MKLYLVAALALVLVAVSTDALKCVYSNPLEHKTYNKDCGVGTTQCGSYTCTFLGQTMTGKDCNTNDGFCKIGDSQCPGKGKCTLCSTDLCNA